MTTIIGTAPPPAPQLPRIEPTDILRAAGHMGIGTAAGHALAEQLMALEEHREKIRNQAEQAEGTAAMIAAAGEELANDLTGKAQAIKAAASAVDNLLGKLADGAADALEKLNPGEIIARSGVQKAQSTLDSLMHVNLPDGLSSLIRTH